MNAIEIFLASASIKELTLVFVLIPGLASFFTLFIRHMLKN